MPDDALIPLRLIQISHRCFSAEGAFGGDDRVYFSDLMTSYGVSFHDKAFGIGRTSFTDMIAGLLSGLDDLAQRFDLAVLASATPDAQPGFPLGFLCDAVPEPGLTYAVLDHGVITPFAALRLLDASVRTGRVRRALVFLADQSTLLHDLPMAGWQRPLRDHAVVLVLDDSRGTDVISRPRSLLAVPEEVPALLEAELRRALPARKPGVAVLGHGAAVRLGPLPEIRTVVAEAGLPCTGVWSTAARCLSDRKEPGERVVLADYDEDQRRLSVCAIDGYA
ncbi:hypothetical protein [Nonomuraea insulae]|uniref:Uncharacterized protein n=1 Tax=Nonomuraea insulae TaxID=1616787 RepID=A0ABW1D6B6_9ACTN